MSLEIILMEPGLSLGKNGETMEIRKEGKVLEQVPLHRILTVTVGHGGSLSTDLLAALADQGTTLLVQDGAGRPCAVLGSAVPWAGAEVRRAQALAHTRASGLRVARALLAAKLTHQARLQRYWASGLPHDLQRSRLLACAEDILGRIPSLAKAEGRQDLMVIEAQAARRHWDAVSCMVPFTERAYPRAPDLVNRLLNYGYAVLSRTWLQLALQAGLDPNLGVLHADRPGRPGLVLDLMEPWRPWVDRAVVGLIRRRLTLEAEGEGLDGPTRYRLLDAIQQTIRAKPAGQVWPLRTLWLRSARRLAHAFVHDQSWQPPLVHL